MSRKDLNSRALPNYVQQLHQLLADRSSHAAELTRLLDRKAFALAADPTRVVLPPEPEAAVPNVDLSALDAVVARLKKSAQAYDESYAKAVASGARLARVRRARLNALLQGMEGRLTDPEGLPGRDWFKHFLYAPGRLTGYGVKTLPAVREAMDAARWDEAQRYAAVTAAVLARYCDGIDEATALLTATVSGRE